LIPILKLSLVVAAALSLAVPASAQTIRINNTPPAKFRAGFETLPATTSAAITSARNEFESFEIFIKNTTTGPMWVSDVVASNLLGPGGHTIPSSQIWFYREAYFNVTNRSSIDGALGYWPDALVPLYDEVWGHRRAAFFRFKAESVEDEACDATNDCAAIPVNATRVLFVDVLVPTTQPGGATTLPGQYQGKVTVKWKAGPTATEQAIEIDVSVWCAT
jgi:hypothetical protein